MTLRRRSAQAPSRTRSAKGIPLDSLSPLDRRLLERAVALGRRGWGRVHPNPMVGAVVARDGSVIAEGHHGELGGPHAEARALAELAGEVGATLYTSLEPCRHRGRTPPCTEAIVGAGVARVVYWAADPNPEAGGGGDWLRGRGVRVEGPFGEEGDWAAENPLFHHRVAAAADPEPRPYLALKLAMSVDGKIAPSGGRRVWLTGPEARAEVHRLRAGFGAILVGTRTWQADNPALTARGAVAPLRPPIPVLLDRRGEATPELRALGNRAARAIVVTEPSARAPLGERLRGRAEVVAVPNGPGGLDLSGVLGSLGERGVESVLSEGGGVLGASLLAHGLVDRLYLFVAPAVIGPGGVEAFPSPTSPGGDMVDSLAGWRQRLEPVRFGSDTLIVLDREVSSIPATGAKS
ncbi:MAG: bifunctional diaminohydroxyphosphoribosylaminopyrimidine deaminase/5-amino-6-(5-phosphoribosylamino)uracil reductase RibD [Gemmatimonadetes bacterium]|nr:bifunctional diaminohydroxyphosphoribosylaminopyrimidine deaminase/5-amino-6-(5-phosphoribosylamino)uracil reductase RibD [Gemmatimonadota bacterium]